MADVQPVLGAIARTAARLYRSRGQCATSLDEAKGSRFAAPEASTPKHLAERIINPKASLEGERKQVTVLFADLKDPMELLADRDPGEACTGEMGMTYWPEKAETEMRNLG